MPTIKHSKNYKAARRIAANLIITIGLDDEEQIRQEVSRFGLRKDEINHIISIINRYYYLFLVRS